MKVLDTENINITFATMRATGVMGVVGAGGAGLGGGGVEKAFSKYASGNLIGYG